MKEIRVVRADEVTTKPFVAHSFTQSEDFLSTMELIEKMRAGSTKRSIRKLAKKQNIPYDSEKIKFASKVIDMMLDEIK